LIQVEFLESVECRMYCRGVSRIQQWSETEMGRRRL